MASVWGWQPDGRVVQISPRGIAGMWYQACIHPDGGHAFFWGGPADEPGRLWRAPTDGSSPAEPLMDAAFGSCRHPAYGVGGDTVVFTSDHGDDRRTPRRTMAGEDATGMPPADRRWNLFALPADGGAARQVTEGDHVDQRPALSPDGGHIAFVSSRGPGIWRVPADGSAAPEQLTTLPLYRPWWAVDGSGIFCFRLSRENRQVGRLDPVSGVWAALPNDADGNTHGPYADLRGDRVLAHSDRDGRWALWEIPLDGSPAVKVAPPGFEDRPHGHGTRARTGEVTFDAVTMT